MPRLSEKTSYLIRNLLKGLAWLAILLLFFVLIKKNLGEQSLDLLEPVLTHPGWVFFIYTVSEFAFGIIPPEVFMLWALGQGSPLAYAGIVAALAAISYLAGITGYGLGYYLQTTRFFQYLRRRRLYKYEERLRTFGAYLIVVAAFTPVPFSAICMLTGSGRYPFGRFLLLALTRFFRFALYAWFVWEANVLS